MTTSVVGVVIVFVLACLSPQSSWAQDASAPTTVRPESPAGSDGDAPQEAIAIRQWTLARSGLRFVTEGSILRLTGGRGWLRNRVEFVDFVLRLEYRITERDAEAAVLVRAWPADVNAWPSTGYRIAIRDASGDGANATGAVRGYSGRVSPVTTNRAEPRPPRVASGEWQELEIRAEGDQLIVVLNGDMINVVNGTEPLAGYVGLEGSRGTIEFRNVRIVRLPLGSACAERTPPEKPQSANAGTVFNPGSGILNPRVRREVRPRYSMEAASRQVQGVVRLQAVVLPDGTVGRVCVEGGLDEDLDAEAVAATKRWLFEPGTRFGKPVAVLVTMELTFRLGRR